MRVIFALKLVLLVGLLAVMGCLGEAQAAKRVALVIGNSAYKYAGELTNPRNDASDLSAVFKRLGFQVVEGIDLDKAAFDRKIRDFAAALQGAELGVFFYAGHGLQVGGQNYLVPTDAELSAQEGLDFEMVRLDLVHRTMERATDTNVIFLDACRNNPLERNLRRAMGTRGAADIGKGLAAMQSGSGTLISFSTQPGNVAADGTGRNSPFAGALVRHLSASNDDLSAVLIAVRNDGMKETQRSQIPWEHSALTGRLYFRTPPQTASSEKPVKPGPEVSESEAERAWMLTKDTTNVVVLEAFVARFKDTFYADLAKVRIEELRKQQTATVSPKPIPKPDTPAATGKPIPDAGQSAWVKLCQNATGGDPSKPVNICLTHHERLDGNTGRVLVSAAVRQIEGRADQHLMVMVPLGMQQGPGMRAHIYPKDKWAAAQKNEKVEDGSLRMIQLPYSLCHAAGCTGEVVATPDMIAELKQAGGIVVYAIKSAGSPAGFPITLAGFEQAYVGAPVDNNKYAEARKKLMEQIAARQADQAKEQAKQKK